MNLDLVYDLLFRDARGSDVAAKTAMRNIVGEAQKVFASKLGTTIKLYLASVNLEPMLGTQNADLSLNKAM